MANKKKVEVTVVTLVNEYREWVDALDGDNKRMMLTYAYSAKFNNVRDPNIDTVTGSLVRDLTTVDTCGGLQQERIIMANAIIDNINDNGIDEDVKLTALPLAIAYIQDAIKTVPPEAHIDVLALDKEDALALLRKCTLPITKAWVGYVERRDSVTDLPGIHSKYYVNRLLAVQRVPIEVGYVNGRAIDHICGVASRLYFQVPTPTHEVQCTLPVGLTIMLIEMALDCNWTIGEANRQTMGDGTVDVYNRYGLSTFIKDPAGLDECVAYLMTLWGGMTKEKESGTVPSTTHLWLKDVSSKNPNSIRAWGPSTPTRGVGSVGYQS